MKTVWREGKKKGEGRQPQEAECPGVAPVAMASSRSPRTMEARMHMPLLVVAVEFMALWRGNQAVKLARGIFWLRVGRSHAGMHGQGVLETLRMCHRVGMVRRVLRMRVLAREGRGRSRVRRCAVLRGPGAGRSPRTAVMVARRGARVLRARRRHRLDGRHGVWRRHLASTSLL